MPNLPTTIYEIYVQRQKSSWTVRRDNKYHPLALPVGKRSLHAEGAPKLERKQICCAWACVGMRGRADHSSGLLNIMRAGYI